MHPTACGPGVPTGNERRMARELAALTGVDVTAAVTAAIRDQLERVRREQGDGLAERLLAIGRDCAMYLNEPSRTVDHGELLFDERGLPR